MKNNFTSRMTSDVGYLQCNENIDVNIEKE